METTGTVKTVTPAETAGRDAAGDTQEPDPFLEIAGRYKDDPFWDEMQESIRRHRREMDAAWDESE